MKTFKLINIKTILMRCALVFFTTISTLTVHAQTADSRGTDFWLMFNTNYDNTGAPKLFITSNVNTSGTISGPGMTTVNFSVTANTVTSVTLSNSYAVNTNNTVANKGIRVQSNDPVSVYGLNQRTATTDAFLGLPVDVLGTEYRILTYSSGGSFMSSQFGIVATQNSTTVSFTPTVTTLSYTAGTTYNVSLNAGQIFELSNTGTGDLTGTRITSDKPIGVFSGNRCANIPLGFGACDHTCEMIPPVSTLGTRFITIPLKSRIGDSYRFMASEDNTTITINGTAQAPINKGQYVQVIRTATAYVESDKPILAAQYSHGQGYDNQGVGDPFMMLIPPLEQFMANYTVGTVSGFAKHYINLVVPSSIVGIITLDGTAISSGSFTALGSTGYSTAQIQVSDGSHTLDAPLPFGAFSYGFNPYDSYGYAGGQSFSPVATASSITVSPTSQTGQTNTNLCLDATVLDQYGDPVVGVKVDFNISGPNTAQSGFANTNSNGVATFCYAGANGGTDAITASLGALNDVATITWNACTAPAFTICPGNQSANTGSNCDAIVTYNTTVTGTTPTVTYSFSGATTGNGSGNGSGSVFNKGTTTVTLTAANSCGTAACSFDVVVDDMTAPVVVTQDITVNLSASGAASITASQIDNGSSDACGIASYGLDVSSFDCSKVGPNTVTLTVTDVNGNSNTGTATVTVKDVTAPTALCKNINLTLSSGAGSITASDINDGSYDNCSIASWTLSKSSFDCSNNGDNTVTLTIADPSGNSSSCTANVAISVISAADAGLDRVVYYGAPSAYSCAALTGTGTGGTGYSYSWTNGATTQTTTVCPSSTTTYTVTITDNQGCSQSDAVKVCSYDVRCSAGKSGKMDKVLVCHKTSSTKNPTEQICIAPSAVADHLNNHNDYLGTCGSTYTCGGSAPAPADVTDVNGYALGSHATLNAFPNPFNTNTNILFSVPAEQRVTIKVFDMAGKELMTAYDDVAPANLGMVISLNPEKLGYGTFILKMNTASGENLNNKLFRTR